MSRLHTVFECGYQTFRDDGPAKKYNTTPAKIEAMCAEHDAVCTKCKD